MSQKWAPINDVLGDARVSRGFYLCAGCKEHVPASIKDGRARVKNVYVDHIAPIVDPTIGWVSWDSTIERMFCEADNLQVLCKACHDKKTQEEKDVAKARRAEEKNND